MYMTWHTYGEEHAKSLFQNMFFWTRLIYMCSFVQNTCAYWYESPFTLSEPAFVGRDSCEWAHVFFTKKWNICAHSRVIWVASRSRTVFSEWAHVFSTKTSRRSYMWNINLMSYMRNICLYAKHMSICETYIYMWNIIYEWMSTCLFHKKKFHVIYVKRISNVIYAKHVSIRATYLYTCNIYLYVKHVSTYEWAHVFFTKTSYMSHMWNICLMSYTWKTYLISYTWNICLYVKHMSVSEMSIRETCIWCHICETYVYMWNIYLYVKHISICEKCIHIWNIYLYVKHISRCETYIYM